MDDNSKKILRDILATLQGTLSVSAPTGAATEAKQDTIITHVDGIETALTSANSSLDAIEASAAAMDTDLTTIIGHVDGIETLITSSNTKLDTLHTDLTGTLAVSNAGLTELAAAINASSQMDVNIAANGIGLATSAKQDTIIGHVDGIETLITSSNTKLDSVISGVDGLEALIGTTNSSLTTIDGRVDGLETSNSAIQTATELIDDTVFVLGTATYTEATSKGFGIAAVRRDADTTLVNTTNEWGPLQMDANGRLKVEVFSGEALPVTQSGTWDEVGINDSGNSITVDAAAGGLIVGDGTNPVVVLAAGADGVANTNNQLVVAGANYVYDVAAGDWNRAIESVQSLNIAGQGLPAVGLAAKFDDTSPQTVTENQFGHLRMSASGVLYVGGIAAHDGVDSTNPVTAGYRAIAHGTNPTAVAAADVTVGYANRAGVPFVIGGHPNPVTIEAEYTSAQTNAAIVTIATGLKIVVTQIQVTADNANSVDVGFRVGFGTASTPTTTGVVLTHAGLQSGGVVSRGDGSGIVGVGADNEDLRITSEVPTTGAIRVLVTYFTVES